MFLRYVRPCHFVLKNTPPIPISRSRLHCKCT
uniref:Uncharacterized protein n=1 Tax=Anguilla anguilla TaxID=7936 RepID=A0A0E9W7M2_ANGAN